MTSATNVRGKTCGGGGYALPVSDRWAFAVPIRERIFGAPLTGGYTLERVGEDAYWDLHEVELREHFPPDAMFYRDELLAPARHEARERVVAAEGAEQLADFWLVRAPDGALAGMFSCRQQTADAFELLHVTMHPDHRGRGLYAELLDRVIAYAQELGFSTTVSEHAPSNNAVLIRHLKAGFRIVAMEIDPAHGMSVRLAYFHEPGLLRAYEYRCGLATMDETLYAAGMGHFALLDEQFAAARAAARGD
jgi:GNAT superfamily N-acetyltransferase